MIVNPAARRASLFLFVTSAQIATVAAGVMVPLFWIVLPPIAKLPVALHWTPPHIDLVPAPAEAAARPLVHRLFRAAGLIAPRLTPHGIHAEPPEAPAAFPDVITTGPDMPAGALGSLLAVTPALPPAPVHKEPAAARAPVRVSQGVQEAKLIRRILPVYPPLAIRTRQFGSVHLEAIVGKDGSIRDIRVLSGPAFLVPAAIEAVRQWLYKPTLLNGEPVEIIAPITINFKLSQ